MAEAAFTLADLEAIIAARAEAKAEKSYTKTLLDGGPTRAAKKFGEEAIEAALAAVASDAAHLTAEAADVLYHLLVLLRARDIPLQTVLNELEKRTLRSGHDEKAARPR